MSGFNSNTISNKYSISSLVQHIKKDNTVIDNEVLLLFILGKKPLSICWKDCPFLQPTNDFSNYFLLQKITVILNKIKSPFIHIPKIYWTYQNTIIVIKFILDFSKNFPFYNCIFIRVLNSMYKVYVKKPKEHLWKSFSLLHLLKYR